MVDTARGMEALSAHSPAIVHGILTPAEALLGRTDFEAMKAAVVGRYFLALVAQAAHGRVLTSDGMTDLESAIVRARPLNLS